MRIRSVVLLWATCLGFGAAFAADPLPSWNDGMKQDWKRIYPFEQ